MKSPDKRCRESDWKTVARGMPGECGFVKQGEERVFRRGCSTVCLTLQGVHMAGGKDRDVSTEFNDKKVVGDLQRAQRF